MQLNNVGIMNFLEKDDLAVGPLGVGWMLEGIEYFLQGLGLSRLLIGHLPYYPVGSAADLFYDGVSFKNVGLDFLWHFLFII